MDANKPNPSEDQHGEAAPWHRRGLIWSVYLIIWTIGLLVPMPEETGHGLSLKFIAAKILHVVAYAGLACLSGWLRIPCRWRWLVLFVIMAHAPATELLQLNIRGRTGTLRDVGLDHLGIGLGLLLTWRWWSQPDEHPL
jgi:hypothetical protein